MKRDKRYRKHLIEGQGRTRCKGALKKGNTRYKETQDTIKLKKQGDKRYNETQELRKHNNFLFKKFYNYFDSLFTHTGWSFLRNLNSRGRTSR